MKFYSADIEMLMSKLNTLYERRVMLRFDNVPVHNTETVQ
jgi:hypothetical protein